MEYFIHQQTSNDCGLAALKMLMARLFRNPDLLFLNVETPPKTFLDLVTLAETYQVTLTGYDTGEDKANFFTLKGMAIVQLQVGLQTHFVFVSNISKRRITIFDPAQGEIVLTQAQFFTVFTGKFLLCQQPSKRNLSFKVERPGLPRGYYLGCILNLLALTCLLAGFYYIEDGVFVLYPVIFLALAAVFWTLERAFLLRLLREFDHSAIAPQIERLHPPYLTNFQHLINYKQQLFVRPQKIFSSFLISSVLIFFLIINSVWNILAVVALVGFLLGKNEIEKRNRGAEYAIIDSQSHLMAQLEAQDKEKVLVHYAQLEDQSARLVEKRLLFNVLFELGLFVIAFGVMIGSRLATVNFLLFHFASYHYLSTLWQPLFTSVGTTPGYLDAIGHFFTAIKQTGETDTSNSEEVIGE